MALLYSTIKDWGVSLQWLRQLLEESSVRQQIIWLDCCFSGELLNFRETDLARQGSEGDRDFIMLDILHKSGGTAVPVTDEELLAAVKEIATAEGIFAAPEGGACLPALKQLIVRGEVSRDEKIVSFNTGQD